MLYFRVLFYNIYILNINNKILSIVSIKIK